MGKKKAAQEELPGMEARDVPEIEQAADRYRQIRDERCALSKEEAEAKAALIQVMKNKGRQFYSYNGLNVQLSNQENVRVKSKDEDEDYEPVGRFTEPKRKRSSEEVAEGWIKQAEEIIEQHQDASSRQAEMEEEASREAVAEFFDGNEEVGENYQAEWRAGLSEGERKIYENAPCSCGHPRKFHGGNESDGECTALGCGPTSPIVRCSAFHCRDCDTKGGHKATCHHYVLGEGTPVQSQGFSPGFPPGFDPERAGQGLAQVDDYSASRCDECKMIDGGHAQTCSKSNALRFDDYLAYARAHYKTNHQSHARKMELSKLKDDEVRAWKRQAGKGVEAEPEPRSTRRLRHG